MTETEQLIQDYLDKGGTITKVPSRIFNRAEYETRITQNSDGLDILIEQAEGFVTTIADLEEDEDEDE